MRIDFHWHPYKYLPYEQILAHRELMALTGLEPIAVSNGLSIDNTHLSGWENVAERTTYFSKAVTDIGSQVIPLQTFLEASSNAKSQTSLFEKGNNIFLGRQSTRYSSHGIHEYRGKFNPQIIRAIGNVLGLREGAWVLDPFCGSGTTLLEASHIGWNALGVDINPLAVQISKAKIAALHIPIDDLRHQVETVIGILNERIKNIKFDRAFDSSQEEVIDGTSWQSRLQNPDYLSSWFTKSVLVQLSAISEEIKKLPSKDVQLVLRIMLSDILREVSLQDPDDLRIRRRKSPSENAPVIPLFINSVKKKMDAIYKARPYISDITTMQEALQGDIQHCISSIHKVVNKGLQFDAAITSPPYACALPYIDTQRLSLAFLGLVESNEIRALERSLIGNRELSNRIRCELEQAIKLNMDNLPPDCLLLCKKLLQAVDMNSDGFRRQNMPALIYKYLSDMASMFRNVHSLLKSNAPFALVVGRNKTELGGKTFVIDTPKLLASLAGENGFALDESIELDTYQRFDVHQANSIRTETLLILRRK